MTKVERAFRIFGISDISQETKDSISKRYRELVRRYHPDNNNGEDCCISISDIKESKDIIDKVRDMTCNNNKIIRIVSLEALKESYKNRVRNFDECIIDTGLQLKCNGVVKHIDSAVKWNTKDEYKIYGAIDNGVDKVEIKLEDRIYRINISSNITTVNIDAGEGIKLHVILRKGVGE